MGRTGYPARPTAIRLLEGNRSKERINKREPKPPPGVPACPVWLDREARAEWRRIVPQLLALNVLSRIDRSTLAGYCATWSQWREVYLDLLEFGRWFSTPNGYQAPRPAVRDEQTLRAQLRQFAGEFGMTPSARSRMETPLEPPRDELSDLLGG